MDRVEYLISEYMRYYQTDYTDAIDRMIADLETAKDNKELQSDSESDTQ